MLQAFKVGLAAKRCDCTCGDIPEEFLRVVTLREPWELQQLVKAVSFCHTPCADEARKLLFHAVTNPKPQPKRPERSTKTGTGFQTFHYVSSWLTLPPWSKCVSSGMQA